MKGYMIKDLLLIKNQKRTLPLLLVCGFFMSFAMQPMVAVTYLAILGTMICVGTISYDEMDHGYSFLLALPPSRKTYVREKFLFSFLSMFLFIVLGYIIALGVSAVKGVPVMADGDSLLSYLCGAIFAASVMQAVLIPTRIKFGTEKSGIVMVVIFAVLAGAALLITKGAGFLPESVKNAVLQFLNNVSDGTMVPIIILLSLLFLLISEQITERIVAKMEF